MPYTASTLSLLGSVNGSSVFHYRNTDSIETMLGAGYFNASAPQFQAGDEIIVSRTGANYGMTSLRVISATTTAVVVTNPRVESQALYVNPLAQASTEFTLTLPPCTILRATSTTTTTFTGATVTIQAGTALGGAQQIAAVSIISQGVVAHTIVASGNRFAGGTLFVRLAQTTPTAVGRAVFGIEYVPD